MSWLKENIKWFIPVFGLICTVVGFIIGVYVQQKVIGVDLNSIKEDIRELKDEDIYQIKQWINAAR